LALIGSIIFNVIKRLLCCPLVLEAISTGSALQVPAAPLFHAVAWL